MMYFPLQIRKIVQMALCSLLVAAMFLPLSGQAASGKKTGSKNKRPVATTVAERKKAASKPSRVHLVVKNGKRVTPAEARRLAARKSSGRTVVSKSRQSPYKLAAHPPASRSSIVRVNSAPVLSNGERLGLHAVDDPLDLNSSVALVLDQDTGEVLFSKNDSAVLPIASLTKLMTGLLIVDAHLPLDEEITITQDDVDTYKGSRSRLAVGTTLTRGEMMHLALMSSENRAAHALGRTFPGGLAYFVQLMNAKARELGMMDTHYVEPTGLMSQNQSSARDLATLVAVAYERPLLRELSTSPGHLLELGNRTLQYNNSNRLIKNPDWDIGLQKTGYISEAGRCLVMQAKIVVAS